MTDYLTISHRGLEIVFTILISAEFDMAKCCYFESRIALFFFKGEHYLLYHRATLHENGLLCAFGPFIVERNGRPWDH